MSKELSIDEWIDELDRGLEYRRRYGLEDSWSELEALFYHVHESCVNEGPNLIASTGDSLLSSLTVPRPTIGLKALQSGLVGAVRILERQDNDFIDTLEIQEQIEDAVLHAYLWGRGILKLGYDSEWGYDPKHEIPELGFTLSQYDKHGERIEFFSLAKPGVPWVKAILPHDIIVPWGTKDENDAAWMAHRVVRHVDDLKADPKYSRTRGLEPTLSRKDFVQSYLTQPKPSRVGERLASSKESEGEVCLCECYEIHDRKTNKVYTMALGHDKWLRNDPDFMQVDGLPFVTFSLVPTARTFWTTPDAYYLKTEQAELADISLQALKQRRLAVLRFIFAEDAFDDEELNRLLGVDVGAGARVKSGTALRDAVLAITPTNNNMVLYQDAEYVRKNARERVGIGRNQMGEFEQGGRRTAFEVGTVKQYADVRMTRRQNSGLARTYKRLFRKLNGIIFEFWKAPRWVEIAKDKWQMFTGRELRGQYKYSVTFSSEPIPTLENRKLMALQMYQALSQDPYINPIALRRYLFDAFSDPEFETIFMGGAQSATLPISMQGQGMSPGGGGAQAGGGQAQLPQM